MHIKRIASAPSAALSHQHSVKRQTWFSPNLSKGKIVKIVHGVPAMSVAAASLEKEA